MYVFIKLGIFNSLIQVAKKQGFTSRTADFDRGWLRHLSEIWGPIDRFDHGKTMGKP